METSNNPNLNMKGFSVHRLNEGKNLMYSTTFYNNKDVIKKSMEDKNVIFAYSGKISPLKYFEVLDNLCRDTTNGVLSESDLLRHLTKITEFTGGQE